MLDTIATERLLLRPLKLADAPRVARFTSDIDVARMVSMIPAPNPLVAAEGWILIDKARRPLKRDFVFAVERPGEGLIGVTGAHLRGTEEVEIGYWFGRPFWGQGFATEAARALASAARELGRVVAGHFIDNPASGRVLQKAGFDYTGIVEPRFSLARKAKVDTRLMALGSRAH
ncbi:MAG: GNAT family N-acetyltransferase [Hyphomonadaceae bacterium]